MHIFLALYTELVLFFYKGNAAVPLVGMKANRSDATTIKLLNDSSGSELHLKLDVKIKPIIMQLKDSIHGSI